MKTTGLFSSMLSGIGIFMVAVGLSLLMVQPAFAIPDCDGGCDFGIIVIPPPRADDCLTIDCELDDDCFCKYGYEADVDYYYCVCVPYGP